MALAPHSSTLAWKIPWTEEPGGLQSMGSPRVGHDWVTSLSLFTFMRWRRKWQPSPVFLPGESQGQGAWWAAVYGVAQSRTRLKWLSSSSSRSKRWFRALRSGRKGPQQSSAHLQCLKNIALREEKSVRYFLRNMNRTSFFQEKRMKGKLIRRARPMIWISVDSLHQENTSLYQENTPVQDSKLC